MQMLLAATGIHSHAITILLLPKCQQNSVCWGCEKHSVLHTFFFLNSIWERSMWFGTRLASLSFHTSVLAVAEGWHKLSFVAASGATIKPLRRHVVYFVSGRYAQEMQRLAGTPASSHRASCEAVSRLCGQDYLPVCACSSQYFCVLILSERLPFFFKETGKQEGECRGV